MKSKQIVKKEAPKPGVIRHLSRRGSGTRRSGHSDLPENSTGQVRFQVNGKPFTLQVPMSWMSALRYSVVTRISDAPTNPW